MTVDGATMLLGGIGGGALVLSLIATPIVRRLALRCGYVDIPFGHKSHRDPMPYGGGVAIFLAGWLPAAALLIAVHLISQRWVTLTFGPDIGAYFGGLYDQSRVAMVILAGALVLFILGIIDDLKPLGAITKLLTMLAVAIGVPALSGVRAAEALGPALSVTITACWFVVIINSFNFLDNMDGLSAGVAAICLLMLGVCGRFADQVLVPALAVLMFGAVAGFLIFNFPPAKLYMGDAGSLLVGYFVAVISTMTTYFESGQGQPAYALAMPLIVLAVPLYDCITVVSIRLREGRNPMQGDQRHFSHRLVDHGLSRRFAVVTIYICTAATGLAATLLPNADLRITLTVVAIVLLVLSIIYILERPAIRPK
ncbi:MAG: MraY family glycosyltransferase [Phycisphaerae bacterium]